MTLIAVWLLAYALPAIGVATFTLWLKYTSPVRDYIVTHGVLIASSISIQIVLFDAHVIFSSRNSPLSSILCCLSVLYSTVTIGTFAIFYTFSVVLQQITLSSIAVLLSAKFEPLLVLLLVVPPFVVCHDLRQSRKKMILFSVGGIASVILFWVFTDLVLAIALHITVGSCLISRSVIYPESSRQIAGS
jgi:hypothetical protein